jgi:predicted nucleotidyltransferase
VIRDGTGEESMRPITDDLLDEMTRRLVDELRPEQIILFGSRAWGTPREDSDVDLFIILPPGTHAGTDLELRARRCLRGLGVSKDVLVRTRAQVERFRYVPASLEAAILSRGRVLYADPQGGLGPELADQGAARPGDSS